MKTFTLKLVLVSAILLMLSEQMVAQDHDSLAHTSQNDSYDYSKRPAVTYDSTFGLSDFKLPEYRRKLLTTDYRLSNDLQAKNQYSIDKYVSPPYHYEIESDRTDFQNKFNLNANVRFLDIFYTRNHQKETSFSASFSGSAENYKTKEKIENLAGYFTADSGEVVKRNMQQLRPSVSYGQTHRHYLGKNWYAGYAPSIHYYATMNRDISKNDIEKNKNLSFSQGVTLRIPLEIGYGRIEPVGDARHAIYILDALRNQGLIETPAASEDIIRFAEFIAQLKNKRHLDARHRRIYEMEALDSFLVANNYADKPSMRYYTTLDDFWVYGNADRESGWRLAVFTTPEYRFQSSRNKSELEGTVQSDGKGNFNTLETYLGIGFDYEKPINLYWQNSFSSSLTYQQFNMRSMNHNLLTDEKHIQYQFEPANPALDYSLAQRISYYPTTRTSMYASYGIDYHFYKRRVDSMDLSLFEHYLATNGRIGATYYFSPQLQLNAEASINHEYFYKSISWQQNETETDDSLDHSSHFTFYFGISLSYAFY